jgi:hypothetical protein
VTGGYGGAVSSTASVTLTSTIVSGNSAGNSGGGRDVLNGGAGDDTVVGGGGRDKYIGGSGIDSYVFDAHVTPTSLFDHLSFAAVKRRADVIVDYEKDEKIILDSDVFKGLVKGPLGADQFHVGEKADIHPSHHLRRVGRAAHLRPQRFGGRRRRRHRPDRQAPRPPRSQRHPGGLSRNALFLGRLPLGKVPGRMIITGSTSGVDAR